MSNSVEIKYKLGRKFQDFLTLLTSTKKLFTGAEFELAPSETPVRRSTSWAIELPSDSIAQLVER